MIEQKQEYELFAGNILNQTGMDMYGVDDVIRLCLVALFSDGHILLEGNPGLGKTDLVKTLSRSLALPYNRIQFTPDLMPSDITGTLMPDPDDAQRLDFRPGPIFTSLLLADEINRATPKTQAAMLEAMAEGQVTVLGEEYQLSQQDFKKFIAENGRMVEVPLPLRERPDRPFIVLATQNPIDHEGTFDLPEAQSDRFMFKVLMPVPSRRILGKILVKTTTNRNGESGEKSQNTINWERYKQSINSYRRIRQKIKEVPLTGSIATHVSNLFLATNNRFQEIDTISSSDIQKLKQAVSHLKYGLGPRAATALIKGAKAWALFFSENSAAADGVDLAQVLIPSLRHRIRLEYGWESAADYRERLTDVDKDRWVDHYLLDLCVAAAPTKGEVKRQYKQIFEKSLRDSIGNLSY